MAYTSVSSRTGNTHNPARFASVTDSVCSKNCHVRNFGTRDLRHANLPHRDDVPSSPPPLPASPVRNSLPASTSMRGSVDLNEQQSVQSPMHTRNSAAGYHTSGAASPLPILKANSVLPARYNRSLSSENRNEPTNTNQHHEEAPEALPRTVPLSPSEPVVNDTHSTPRLSSVTLGRSNSTPMASLQPTPTGSRYGAALGGGGSPVKVFSAGVTPVCPRCEKSVYFAEQVCFPETDVGSTDVRGIDEGHRKDLAQGMSAVQGVQYSVGFKEIDGERWGSSLSSMLLKGVVYLSFPVFHIPDPCNVAARPGRKWICFAR